MTLRSGSRRRQWMRWLCAALVALAVHAVATHLVLGSVSFDLLDPDCYRLALPLAILLLLFAWETRWDGIRRGQGDEKVEAEGQAKAPCEVEEQNLTACASSPPATDRPDGESAPAPLRLQDESGATRRGLSAPTLSTYAIMSSYDDATGETLFDKARTLPHQMIPDFATDAWYLDLLGQSAAKGFAPAQAKLGEYAMRRGAWVEAYYWMWRAQRGGMCGLATVMLEIRKNWSLAGFPDEAENVNPIFTSEAGSVGRALLAIASGHDAAAAREFLKGYFPEYQGGMP